MRDAGEAIGSEFESGRYDTDSYKKEASMKIFQDLLAVWWKKSWWNLMTNMTDSERTAYRNTLDKDLDKTKLFDLKELVQWLSQNNDYNSTKNNRKPLATWLPWVPYEFDNKKNTTEMAGILNGDMNAYLQTIWITWPLDWTASNYCTTIASIFAIWSHLEWWKENVFPKLASDTIDTTVNWTPTVYESPATLTPKGSKTFNFDQHDNVKWLVMAFQTYNKYHVGIKSNLEKVLPSSKSFGTDAILWEQTIEALRLSLKDLNQKFGTFSALKIPTSLPWPYAVAKNTAWQLSLTGPKGVLLKSPWTISAGWTVDINWKTYTLQDNAWSYELVETIKKSITLKNSMKLNLTFDANEWWKADVPAGLSKYNITFEKPKDKNDPWKIMSIDLQQTNSNSPELIDGFFPTTITEQNKLGQLNISWALYWSISSNTVESVKNNNTTIDVNTNYAKSDGWLMFATDSSDKIVVSMLKNLTWVDETWAPNKWKGYFNETNLKMIQSIDSIPKSVSTNRYGQIENIRVAAWKDQYAQLNTHWVKMNTDKTPSEIITQMDFANIGLKTSLSAIAVGQKSMEFQVVNNKVTRLAVDDYSSTWVNTAPRLFSEWKLDVQKLIIGWSRWIPLSDLWTNTEIYIPWWFSLWRKTKVRDNAPWDGFWKVSSLLSQYKDKKDKREYANQSIEKQR